MDYQNNTHQDSTLNSSKNASSIKRYLPIGILAISIVATIVVVLLVKSPVAITHSKKPELTNILKEARSYLLKDQLSEPPGANALEVYRRALKLYPDSPTAKAGIHEVGLRYRDLISDLIADGDLALANQTYNAALRVEKEIENKELRAALTALNSKLNNPDQSKETNIEEVQREPLEVFRDELAVGGFGPEMVVLPAGSFVFGSGDDEIGRDGDEGPQIEVALSTFAIGKTEISFEQYQVFAQANELNLPNDNGWGTGNLPVINVSWRDARRYAQWLSEQTGQTYRLPSETEWEYAARAGTDTAFVFGECINAEQVNFDGREASVLAGCEASEYRGRTVAVDELASNAWGLLHIHGNVREWLRDCWEMSYYEHPQDGSANYLGEGGSCGDDGKRLTRGGAWSASIESSRTANRFALEEFRSFNSIGFRLVREL